MDTILDLTAFIARDGDELVTDSRAVALAFKKQHKNVLRTIDHMRNSPHAEIAEHYRLNFEPVDFIDKNGDLRPMYRMTQKGVSELAMGFTGDLARIVRIRFLNAFEKVAERLAQKDRTITAMLHDLERRELPSKVKGQIGSQLMNQRKVEKRSLAEERETLMSVAQPGLPLH